MIHFLLLIMLKMKVVSWTTFVSHHLNIVQARNLEQKQHLPSKDHQFHSFMMISVTIESHNDHSSESR